MGRMKDQATAKNEERKDESGVVDLAAFRAKRDLPPSGQYLIDMTEADVPWALGMGLKESEAQMLLKMARSMRAQRDAESS